MDIVKTIADAELIVGAERVIQLGQEVTIVNRTGKEARGNPSSLIAGCRKPGVDRVDVRGRDDDESA